MRTAASVYPVSCTFGCHCPGPVLADWSHRPEWGCLFTQCLFPKPDNSAPAHLIPLRRRPHQAPRGAAHSFRGNVQARAGQRNRRTFVRVLRTQQVVGSLLCVDHLHGGQRALLSLSRGSVHCYNCKNVARWEKIKDVPNKTFNFLWKRRVKSEALGRQGGRAAGRQGRV